MTCIRKSTSAFNELLEKQGKIKIEIKDHKLFGSIEFLWIEEENDNEVRYERETEKFQEIMRKIFQRKENDVIKCLTLKNDGYCYAEFSASENIVFSWLESDFTWSSMPMLVPR